MPKNHDLAIRWNDQLSSVRRLERNGSVPIHGFPKHFRIPGGVVAIVGRNNEIKFMFRAAGIDGPRTVTLANGKDYPNGYIIKSDKKTRKRPTHPLPAPFKGWHAIGAFRYFDASKMKAVLVGDNFEFPGEYIEDSGKGTSGVVFRAHVHGIPGMSHNNPEAMLVEQYVSWMSPDARFGHNYIRESKLFVDLFDLTHWQLIEAKASISRESIRMAMGQLLDYRRYYPARHPSLAVLLPSRPTAACVKFLNDNRIAAIWKTTRGAFRTKRWQSA